ncbi:MAG TPA: ABC transporter substrate-binding protein [Microthrixaceae bacterium]|nr:ABC transporter substrate-binding protein [Microthrixaceae bacterium]
MLAACGDDSSDADDNSETTAAEAGAGTVTIEHVDGETEVPVASERIVALDAQWTDVLVAMDHAPVGYIADPNVEGGSFPWRGDDLDAATAMTATDQLPWEQIAALQPDLIVVAYFAQSQADYDRLTAIAPTIATLSDSQVDTWQDITTTAGTVLGDEDKAAEVIEETNASVEKVAESCRASMARPTSW